MARSGWSASPDVQHRTAGQDDGSEGAGSADPDDESRHGPEGPDQKRDQALSERQARASSHCRPRMPAAKNPSYPRTVVTR
jgi:hypothetical protein